jgi:serine phosphatase RsbU (regulator of sigma subunit)/pSer/pThr/pTyr-binding forkhead associated (FHA) protein
MPKLTVRNGPNVGAEFPFDKTVVIGRGPMSDLSFDDPLISRRHAILNWDNEQCLASDLGSDNGTYVNKRPLSDPVRLRDGDTLSFGAVIVEYADDAPALESQPAFRPDESSVHIINDTSSTAVVSMRMNLEAAETEPDSGAPEMSRQIRFLSGFSEVVAGAFDDTTLMSFVLEEILAMIPAAERSFVMLWNEDEKELEHALARNRSGRVEEVEVSRTLLSDVVEGREAVIVLDSKQDSRYQASGSLHRIDIRSAICVPMMYQDVCYGIIQADRRSAVSPFNKGDMALMIGVASQVAMFLAHQKLHRRLLERQREERDMMLAREVQQQFLPESTPALQGYAFAVDYSPALAVGGDYYDFPLFADGRIGIALGDVSGKGVSAALYVAKLSSDLRYHAARHARPADVLRHVNAELTGRGKAGMFVTLVLIALDPSSGRFDVASAGHHLPLLRDAGGSVEPIGETGDPPLGLGPDSTFHEYRGAIAPAEVVVLFTDGISEAENPSRDLFGERRLHEIIRASPTPGTVLDTTLSAVKSFAGSRPQSDDITLLAFGREA